MELHSFKCAQGGINRQEILVWFHLVWLFNKEIEDVNFFDMEGKKGIGKILCRAPILSSSDMLESNCVKTQLNDQKRQTGAEK